MTVSLDTAIRTLQLPVKPGTGDSYTKRAEEILTTLGIVEDQADWVNLEAAGWEKSGVPSAEFRKFVEQLLYSPERIPVTFALDLGSLGSSNQAKTIFRNFSSRYFEMHDRIIIDERCSHYLAQRILAHSHSIFLLAFGDRMTASRIFTMLHTDGIVLGQSWSTPRYILNKSGLKQEVLASDLETLFVQDESREPDLLGDLSLEASVDYVAGVCARFGYTRNLQSQLIILIVGEIHAPYLCMLHFQLTVQAFFNHRLTNAYEFEPRGSAVLWLANKYNTVGLSVGLSPFLNNAKSVDAMDAAWASSKKPKERHAARALSEILAELDCLSDPSRTAAGQYIRALLHRKIRIKFEEDQAKRQTIPNIDATGVQRLLDRVAEGNTGTQGVIEQRLADCVALFEAGDLSFWKQRGFGDSVFTTNTSQKKLGDAELKHAHDPRIIAFEAHGGHLSKKYVDDHISTLRQILPARIAEFEDRVPIGDWRLEIQFIAHTLEPGMPTEVNIEGLPVSMRYRCFEEFRTMEVNPEFLSIVADHFTTPLNAIHIHPRMREVVLNLI